MKKNFICSAVVALIGFASSAAFGSSNAPVLWDVKYHDITSARKGISDAYCRSHSPDNLRGTVAQFMNEGVKAKGGVTVKYKSYDESEKNGLYFATVDAVFSGFYAGKPWQIETWMQEQKVTPNGRTDVVWSNNDCKGKFTGAPARD